MKRRIAIVLSFLMIISLMVPVSAANIVESVTVSDNTIVVKGETGVVNDNVTITLLKPGVTMNSLAEIQTSEDFISKIAYTVIVTTDYAGRYEKRIKASDVEGTTLYVTNKAQTYLASVSNQGVSSIVGKYVNFADYRDDKIIFKGKVDFVNTEIMILVLKNGYFMEDYISDNSVLYKKVVVKTDNEGRYEASLDDDLAEGEKYYAYVVKSDSIYESHKNNTVVLQKPTKIYVSKNKTGDNVFQTINSARDYLRVNLMDVPVDVVIDGGEYEPLTFTDADKRSISTRVKYVATQGEKVVISGGKKISTANFKKVTDEEILNRVYENARENLFEIDLRNAGVPEDVINFTEGLANGTTAPVPYVYLNDDIQPIAQYPNQGFVQIGTVKNKGANLNDSSTGTGKFVYNDLNALERWKTADNLFVKGYLYYTWAGEWAQVDAINTSDKTITLKNATRNGVEEGKRFAVVNLLEEIDRAGEWFIDKNSGKLYYYAPYELTEDDVFEIGGVQSDVVKFTNTENIILENITIEKNRANGAMNAERNTSLNNNGIELSGTNSVGIFDCTIRNIAGNGIATLAGCTDIWVDNCRIYNIGLSGVVLSGENKETLVSTNNIVSNCNISDVSLNHMSNSGAGIKLQATGNLVEFNTIHNVPTNAISYLGSENIMRNNEIYLASTETADSGAFYTGRRWDSVGNIIEKNYIHKIGPKEDVGKKVWYIYFDDAHAGNIARSNILVGTENKNSVGVQIAQGPNNVVNSNTFVNFSSDSIVDLSYRNGFESSLFQLFESIPYNASPYTEKYPYLEELGKLYDEESNAFDYSKYKENIDISYNISNNSKTLIKDDGVGLTSWWFKNGYRNWRSKMVKTTTDNRSNVGDVFVNSSVGDYRTKKDYNAPIGVLSEENFDLNTIGTQKNVSSLKTFDLVAPYNGEMTVKTSTYLTWENSPDADSYIYTVATDKEFSQVIKSGSTSTNFVKVEGLKENTVYYWKVSGVKENRATENWNCNKVYTFATYTNESNIPDVSYGIVTVKNEKGDKLENVSAGEKIVITDEIISEGFASDKLVYIFATYDKENQLIYTIVKHTTVVANDKPVVVMEFVAPDEKGVDKYKIFRWQSFETLKPIQ